MTKLFTEHEQFNKVDFRLSGFPQGEYENCVFRSCNLSQTDLSGIIFSECIFEDCDFSMAKLSGSSFRDVTFKSCKLMGLRFDECNKLLISFSFESCVLNFSSFYKLKLKNSNFKECKLQEVDFAETDLSKSNFHTCDLLNAIFDNTVLEGADLRSAFNFSIDPEKNKIRKAKFSTSGISGLLNKYDISIE